MRKNFFEFESFTVKEMVSVIQKDSSICFVDKLFLYFTVVSQKKLGPFSSLSILVGISQVPSPFPTFRNSNH
jgi:hypothetical protein